MVSGGTLAVSRPLAALLVLVAIFPTDVAPSANAGVLERTKAAVGYLNNLVGEGTDLVGKGMLGGLAGEDYDRRADAFFGKQTKEGLRTFAEISADGHARIAARWKGLKGKIADTVLGKMASSVRDKLWESFLPGAGSTRAPKAVGRGRRGSGAGWPGERWTDDDPRDGRAVSANPALALDIDADELPWYRRETGILDAAPLPRVRISRATRDEPPVAGRVGAARSGCADPWSDCRDDSDGSDDPTTGSERPDRWGGSDESQRSYARALAGISEPSAPDPPSRAGSADGRDYRSALDDLKAQARENARIETERAAALEAERRAAIGAREARASASARAPRSNALPAGRSMDKRPSQPTAAARKPTGPCATGPICKKYAQRGEALVRRVRGVVDRKRLDITGNSLALAFIARATTACVRVCIEREETRAHCQSGLRNAIRELQKTYKSAIGSARSASGNSSYVNQFDSNPQNSRFVKTHFGRIGGNIDTCEPR